MKQYVCHKRVRAAKIIAVTEFVLEEFINNEDALPSVLGLALDNGDTVREEIGKGILARYTPVIGDYLVEYEPDGYRSISPKAVFEDGYHEITLGTLS